MLLVPLLLYRSSLSDSPAFFFFSVFSSLFSSLILFAYYFTLNIDFCVQCFFSLFSALYIYIYIWKNSPLYFMNGDEPVYDYYFNFFPYLIYIYFGSISVCIVFVLLINLSYVARSIVILSYRFLLLLLLLSSLW